MTFPALTQVIAASNPCPCGFRGDRLRSCRCTASALDRYRRRLSGPFLDRFDLRLFMGSTDSDSLLGGHGEHSAAIRHRVLEARRIQVERGEINGRLGRAQMDTHTLDRDAEGLIGKAVNSGLLTGRGVDRVRRVARTIADLAREPDIRGDHVAEALAFRGEV